MPNSYGPPRNHIAGRDYSVAIRGRILDDATIRRYILAGYYGAGPRADLIANEAKRPRRQRTASSVTLALRLLDVQS